MTLTHRLLITAQLPQGDFCFLVVFLHLPHWTVSRVEGEELVHVCVIQPCEHGAGAEERSIVFAKAKNERIAENKSRVKK